MNKSKTVGTRLYKMEHPQHGQRCMIFTERTSRWQFADFFSRYIGVDDASYFALYGDSNEVVPFVDVVAWLPEPAPPTFMPIGRVKTVGDNGEMIVPLDVW